MKYIVKTIQPIDLKANDGSGYPEPFRSQVLPREKRALGDAAGLTKIGINHTTLWPGAASSMRHWHTQEDELVYVLSGELVLVTNGGEQALKAGQCAGFPAGHPDGHQLVNRGPVPVVYLEISNRECSRRPGAVFAQGRTAVLTGSRKFAMKKSAFPLAVLASVFCFATGCRARPSRPTGRRSLRS